jgi:peptidoglycan hydrolase-like protein with peptidoglycan-binding domain
MALARGSKGDEVRALQQFLADLGYDLDPDNRFRNDGIDGDFGGVTEAALRQYQEDNGLDVTGSVDGTVDDFIASYNTTQEEGGEPPAEGEAGEGVDAGGGVTVSEGAPEEESQAEEGVGTGAEDPETQLTILTGNEMNWYFDENSGNWYVGYGLPNSNRETIFEASPGQMDALFGDGFRPDSFQRISQTALLNREETTFAGNIAEVEGEGSIEDEITRITAIALDGGALPSWMEESGEALDIIYIAQAEGKSNAWVLDQLAKTEPFQTRFPQINEFQSQGNLTLVQAVNGFLEMEAGMRSALQSVGEDIEGVTPEIVGATLAAGHSLTTVQMASRTMKRMNDNMDALNAFNQILVAEGRPPLSTMEEMFSFVNGQSETDLYNLWEASSVQELANAVGLGGVFGADDAINLALRTPGSTVAPQVEQGLRSAGEMLLRLRHEINAEEFGLTQDDILDMSLGQAPTSGASQAEVQERMNQALLSARAQVQSQRARPFTGFSPSGTPSAQSLRNLRQGQ